MSRLLTRGKYLFDGAQKFYARGVSYGPFAPNSRGEQYPEKERVTADFALMRTLGANVVRVYVSPPPWVVEEAARADLRILLGIPWPYHIAILDSKQMTREIRETIRKTVAEMRQFGQTIFAYTLANEIRSDIVRWHGPRAVSRFLRELHEVGKDTDPEGLFTYSNYPSTEYLDLSFLDFISFNVYLHREQDFRRYLTHLMAQAGDLPLILSETGMDTIREGEEHQAELLSWQGRAAFELGLSGFVVFAFTDDWYTGGQAITDWAFGLTRRDRSLKPAFGAMQKIFANELPPTLTTAPRASVVVASYNAASTLAQCLDSLTQLNYPNYEVIVVDDGSTDATSSIAQAAGVRTVRIEHQGLATARNAGIEAASGEVVAFIDADARADRDWLYHLTETITRRDAAAAGGPNFAPASRSIIATAMAAAPGLPREVRAGDDRLAQLCGCNMAITKSALKKIGGFDPMFTSAGDDVDLSWRLAAADETLAYAPGATVLHDRRATLAAYLGQQRGYGAGEGLLFRKYPLRSADDDGIYASGSWLSSIFGGARVYYGAFGRGLFQTVYSSGSQYAELPLTIQWMLLSAILLLFGFANRLLGVLGGAGLTTTLVIAALVAATSPMPRARFGIFARIYLFILNLLGPLSRSLARERLRWRIERTDAMTKSQPARSFGGSIKFLQTDGSNSIDSSTLLAALQGSLIRRGLAVAITDGFHSYDLEVMTPALIRMPLNALVDKDRAITLLWRLRIASRRALIAAAIVLVILLAAGLSLGASVTTVLIAASLIGGVIMIRAARISAIIISAASTIADGLGLHIAGSSDAGI